MRPAGILEAIQKILKAMEAANGIADDKYEKGFFDEYMFCFRNCYTEDETVNHMSNKFPSSVPADVRKFFKLLLSATGKEPKKAYLKDAEDCSFHRRKLMRDTSEEAKNSQGEASTSHICKPNCKKRYPKFKKN
ncbi:unnamed protein product [Arabidopsis arenosa]|uniref:Uncharacterized protein n=1 Tax=Arabidopsis arenosa TaxID=38785 RepID=A0A8S1ZM88_ARAAE|nr:unnamed protein product [Arabidopsis arenosa]